MAKKAGPQEGMRLLYTKRGGRLYGHIAFYRRDHQDKTKMIQHRQSRPFVIGESEPGSERLVVFGSVDFLLREIRRTVEDFIALNKQWWFSRKDQSNARIDSDYDRHVMDFVILVSTHTRNLFHLINRLNDREITKFTYENKPDGTVKMKELFDILIHNRYYYFDGTHIRDIFSDKFGEKSRISSHFMGYGFELGEFINGVIETIRDVQMRDLTQILRGKFKNLDLNSDAQAVVSLIQNLHSFSEIMKEKIPSSGYNFMMNLMFANIPSEGKTEVRILFESPNIGINSDLTRKEFEIKVRYTTDPTIQTPDRKNLKDHGVSVGYHEFFNKVNTAFGKDRLIADVPQVVMVGDGAE